MRFEFILLRGAFNQVCDFVRASVFMFVQREREQRPTVRSKLVALAVQLVKEVGVAVTAFGEGVDHVSAGLIINRVAVVSLAGVQHRRQLLAALVATPGFDLITRTAGHRQTVDDVSSHKRIGLVVFPPTPAAVAVLVGVEPIQTLLHFRVQIVRGANLRRRNVLERLRDDDVRQETRHRLFRASVWIARQVIERAEQGAGN